uniref:Sensor histidine kinase n=1 Tax=Ignavibacterium album TaxID=591197 RepID=A0A832DNL1_9BACT
MNKKFYTNLILIAQSFAIYIFIQSLSYLFGRSNPMLLGILILTLSLSVFSFALVRAYLKDRSERRKLSNAVFELN